MIQPYLHPLRVSTAAVLLGFAVCLSAAAGVEPDSILPESSAASTQQPTPDIEAAVARVDAARARAQDDPLALEEALVALGDALFDAGQYAPAETVYTEALQLSEHRHGAKSVRTLAPLLGLGNTLAESGRHEEAVSYLQRAVAVTRTTHGVFDARQQEALRTLAASLTALGDVSEAQDLMLYRVRVAEKTHGEADPNVIPALCELGDWFTQTAKPIEARMTFQVALNIIKLKLDDSDLAAVEPLRGLARTYMLSQSYPQSAMRSRVPPAFRHDASGKPAVTTRNLDDEGERALRQALQILETNPHASPQARIDTLLQMGDWYQIKKSPQEALPHYQRAWQLMSTAQPQPSSAVLSFPVRVYYPMPTIVARSRQPEQTQSTYVQVEFTVEADGSVSEARVVDHDTREQYAADILDAVRDARFRPRFVDGQPVATRAVSYREVIGKPRE